MFVAVIVVFVLRLILEAIADLKILWKMSLSFGV